MEHGKSLMIRCHVYRGRDQRLERQGLRRGSAVVRIFALTDLEEQRLEVEVRCGYVIVSEAETASN